jgi:tripeptide aminopeptidase
MVPEEGRSAILAAARAVADLRLGRLDEETTANVGTIEGGVARNIVADRCDVRLEVRSRDHDRALKECQLMLDALAHAANAAECELETVATQEYRAYKLRRTDPVVQVAWAALESRGFAPSLLATGGGADAHLFNERGIPCANLGNGMELIHTPDERIAVADVEAMVGVTLALVEGARGVT